MPEPTSIVLLGGSLMGVFLKFTKRCFEQTKRVMDVILSLSFLLILSPLVLVLALAIKLSSPGKIIFSQVRVGKSGKLFTMYKFRSMRADAEKHSGPVWARLNDPRVTPIGSFLRRTHLDEIPQFFNVIKGDMSIIGPRPERPNFVNQLTNEIPDYQKRVEVRPGITGLAQVKHRYDQSVEDVKHKLSYDLEYIKSVRDKSWSNEFRIMLSTLLLMLTGKVLK